MPALTTVNPRMHYARAVTMSRRWVITALTLVVAAGCEPTAPTKKPKVATPMPSSSAPSRHVALAPVAIPERPSELQPVTDDRPDPEAQRQFEARIAQPAVALVASQAPVRVTAIALDDTRRGEAPGMTPAGDVFQATLTEGQRGTMPVKLAAGECAAFIAQGGLGVVEVDLFLTGGDGASGRILAEDTATGPIAVIGGRGRCVRGANGAALDAMLNVAVRRGAGVVLVRQYRR
jgi:hypothetical protein